MTKKRAIIVGATSGIGKEVTLALLQEGWTLGIAGRREHELKVLQSAHPGQVFTKVLDINNSNAPELLMQLIAQMGGMELYFHASGVGNQNRDLKQEIETSIFDTNVTGFGRMIITAYQYFKQQGKGHIAIISSIAGTKGLGPSPAYSASKAFQNTYIEALEQLAGSQKLNISFTDIRPGFVQTDLLKNPEQYPMLMKPKVVAQKIVRALAHRKRVVVVDWRYAILVFFWRLIPRWIWVRVKL